MEKIALLLKYPLLLGVLAIVLACGKQIKLFQKYGETDALHLQKMHPDYPAYLSRNMKFEILANGFTWAEGPVWIPESQSLLFSDVPENKIYRWNKKDGLSTYLMPSGFTGQTTRSPEPGSNGLAISSDDKLILCQHGDRRVAVMQAPLNDPTSSFLPLAESYQGKRLNSPNDLCIKSNGDIYFTDPPYGLKDQEQDPEKELPFQGVYLLRKNGELILLVEDLTRPNGIALSPDESILYVANSDPEKAIWYRFLLDKNGEIMDSDVFYDATRFVTSGSGLPDGLKVDSNGIVYATGPGGVWLFSPKGDVLGKIEMQTKAANCALDDRESTLYVTADSLLISVRL